MDVAIKKAIEKAIEEEVKSKVKKGLFSGLKKGLKQLLPEKVGETNGDLEKIWADIAKKGYKSEYYAYGDYYDSSPYISPENLERMDKNFGNDNFSKGYKLHEDEWKKYVYYKQHPYMSTGEKLARGIYDWHFDQF